MESRVRNALTSVRHRASEGASDDVTTPAKKTFLTTHANNVFPPDINTMHLKKSVHFVEYFPCGCFGAKGFAKQKVVFQIPIIYITYKEAKLG